MVCHSLQMRMPKVILSEETVQRLEALQSDDESYDELVAELLTAHDAEELSLFGADAE